MWALTAEGEINVKGNLLRWETQLHVLKRKRKEGGRENIFDRKEEITSSKQASVFQAS